MTYGDRVPLPGDVPAIEVGDMRIPARGWTWRGVAYAFTIEPGPSGRFHAAMLRLPGGQKIGSSTNHGTQDEAIEQVARLYWQQAFGANPATYDGLAMTGSRFDYWRARKAGLGGGELYGQIQQLMEEIIPADTPGRFQLRAHPAPPMIELVGAGDDGIRGTGASMNDAIADFLVKLEEWVATRKPGPPGSFT